MTCLISIVFFISPISACTNNFNFSNSNNIPSEDRSNKTETPDLSINNLEQVIEANNIHPEQSNPSFPINSKYNYSDVLMVYNENSGISTRVAQYFKAARDIPDINMCNITTLTSETVSRSEFENIRGQIENYLETNNLTNKINYIVTTKGVPLRVSGGSWTNACLDSELTMILGDHKNNIDNSYWFVNPYFEDSEPFSREKYSLYLVTRLTAFTEDEIYKIIDNATNSSGNRGNFVLDADADKGWSPGGYGDGNIWLRDANTTLTAKGIPTYYEDTNTYVKTYSNVMGYASWGSNDGHDTTNYLSNPGFESSNVIPYNWDIINDPGIPDNVSVNKSVRYSHQNSLQITRVNTSSNYSGISQDITLIPGMRYYMRGLVNVSSLSGPGGAHLQLQVLDSNDKILKIQNSQVWTTVGNAWVLLRQVFYEPVLNAVKARILLILNQSSGTVFFDDIRFNDIPPHMAWVPGSIAETFVSTGGRSFTYGTQYGQSLVADLVRDGVTGVKGYVYEPFLSAIAHPDILFDRYTDGYNLAESYYMASNFIGWMDVVVGDPKMAPYADDLADLEVTLENISYYPELPNENEEVIVNISVTNNGFFSASNCNVRIFIVNGEDEILIKDYFAPIINGSGDRIIVKKRFFPDFGGEAYIRVQVDPNDKIKELDEYNNLAKKDIYINSRPIVKKLTSIQKSVYRGQKFNLIANGSDLETKSPNLIPTLEAKHEPYGYWFKFQPKQIKNSYLINSTDWEIAIKSNYTMLLGNYSFRVTLTDENNFTSQYYLSYRALEILNNNPEIKSVTMSVYRVYRTATVNISCKVFDLEDSDDSLTVKLQYRLKPADISSKLGWLNVYYLIFDSENLNWVGSIISKSKEEIGDYQIRGRVLDLDKNKSQWEYAFPDLQLLNNPPVVSDIFIKEKSVYRTESVDIFVSGNDIEDYKKLEFLTSEIEYGFRSSENSNYDNINWETTYLSKIEYDSYEDAWHFEFTPPANLTTGKYLFRSRIMDRDGNWSFWYINETPFLVLNNPPVASMKRLPKWVYEDENILFDSENSNDIEDESDELIYYWEIGLGPSEVFTSNDKWFMYSLNAQGSYDIKLKVTDVDGAYNWSNLTVKIENLEPVAKVSFDDLKYKINEEIMISGAESNDSISDKDTLTYFWKFGDGKSANGSIVNHSYTEKGTYTITLNVTDDDGAYNTVSKQIIIYPASEQPPGLDKEKDTTSINYLVPLIAIIIIIIVLLLIWLLLRKRDKKEPQKTTGITQTLPPQPQVPQVPQPPLPQEALPQTAEPSLSSLPPALPENDQELESEQLFEPEPVSEEGETIKEDTILPEPEDVSKDTEEIIEEEE